MIQPELNQAVASSVSGQVIHDSREPFERFGNQIVMSISWNRSIDQSSRLASPLAGVIHATDQTVPCDKGFPCPNRHDLIEACVPKYVGKRIATDELGVIWHFVSCGPVVGRLTWANL